MTATATEHTFGWSFRHEPFGWSFRHEPFGYRQEPFGYRYGPSVPVADSAPAPEPEPEPPVRVIVESPFAGDVHTNVTYARMAMRDCLLNHGEAPYASHLLYTQPGVLDDDDPLERALGISAGFSWGLVADKVVVYTDLGITEGMIQGIATAKRRGLPVEYRQLGGCQ